MYSNIIHTYIIVWQMNQLTSRTITVSHDCISIYKMIMSRVQSCMIYDLHEAHNIRMVPMFWLVPCCFNNIVLLMLFSTTVPVLPLQCDCSDCYLAYGTLWRQEWDQQIQFIINQENLHLYYNDNVKDFIFT